jgi:hypothetical protein
MMMIVIGAALALSALMPAAEARKAGGEPQAKPNPSIKPRPSEVARQSNPTGAALQIRLSRRQLRAWR